MPEVKIKDSGRKPVPMPEVKIKDSGRKPTPPKKREPKYNPYGTGTANPTNMSGSTGP